MLNFYNISQRIAIATLMPIFMLAGCGDGSSSNNTPNINNSTGQAGSLATFTIVQNNLYVMDKESVVGFSLDTPTDPQQFDRYPIVQRDGETIFNHQNSHLFVGKQTGVDIIGFDEFGKMNKVAEHSHVTACDPVITQGNRSFVTTRAGQRCLGGIDRLEVLDITDIDAPNIIFSLTMPAPNGLAVKGNDLFICDLEDGLTRFTITDDENGFNLTPAYISDIFPCDDIILRDDHLILSHAFGITQVRWSGDEFTVLSDIEVQ